MADEIKDALAELYYAFGSTSDERVERWWEAQAERAAEHGWGANDVRREALARARIALFND
jgi:hypothetical protein